MKAIRKSLLRWLVAGGLTAELAAAEGPAAPPAQPAADANNAFALDMHAKLRKAPGNLFYSPFSIATCLHMVKTGARGETRAQLDRLLHTRTDGAAVEEAYGRLVGELAAETNRVAFQMANGLWAQKRDSIPIKEQFLRTLRRNYAAEFETLDFHDAPALAADTINRWAAERTHGKITAVVDPAQFSELDALVLASAIYFKADWEYQFSKSATAEGAFHVTKERSVPVKLMTQTGTFPLVETGDFLVLELAYVGREFRMLILLPRAVDGLARLEASLSDEFLARCLAGLKKTEVHVALPTFRLDHRIDLKAILSGMGVLDMFVEGRADFSGVDGTRTLFVGWVNHLASVEVNEQGTEAAAVTHSMMMRSSIPQYVTFRADHPFLFLIFHRRTGMTLFLGRLVEPTGT